MRRCVVFLYYKKGGDMYPAGTAFFVAWPVPNHGDAGVVGLLTAHHVIAGIRGASSDDGNVHLRVNTEDGGATWVSVSAESWLHPDAGVDCAMLLWSPDPEMKLDYQVWHLDSSATTEVFLREGIGTGDEVFMVGLFRNHLGRDRIEPIVRVGNIAATPADPIKTTAYGDMKAILVEARSIGGLSGSPVFVHLGFSRWIDGTVKTWTPAHARVPGPFILLGLMHGHWDAIEADVDMAGDREKVNMGIGIVVPAEQIIAACRPPFEEAAEEYAKLIEQGIAPT
jgi:hypothetical protein